MSTGLEPLKNARTILLTTYKRDSTPVSTPVSVGFDGERGFFRTAAHTGKSKRLRNNPNVEVAPSTSRGKTTGPTIKARAMLLEGEEARIAANAVARNNRFLQGFVVPTMHRLRNYQPVCYELHIDPGAVDSPTSGSVG